MVTVNFWTFSKKENSTARPAGSPTALNCNILRGSSMMAPTLELDLGSTAPTYNYCQISSFGRYYFIREWYFQGGLWTATLQVDVLATYKSQIGSASLYALRTSNATLYDGSIPDTMYPAKAGGTFTKVSGTDIWNPGSYDGGLYILGCVCHNAEFGSIRYYAVPSNRMEAIISYLTSTDLLQDNNFSLNDASLELQKSLIDPAQYIKSCVYIPVRASDIYDVCSATNVDLDILDWTMLDSVGNVLLAKYVLMSAPAVTISDSITLPKHPQAASRGTFLNQAPYTRMTFNIPPFGNISLDTSITANAVTLDYTITVDLPTGLGILVVSCNGIILNRLEAQVGVPIQLSQITRDYPGMISSAATAGVGLIESFINPFAGIGAVASSIGNAVVASQPREQSIGSGGSFAQLIDTIPSVNAQFFTMVDDDVACNGRPCCKVVNCSSGGYFLIQDADISLAGTAEESAAVREYLENGFYYE